MVLETSTTPYINPKYVQGVGVNLFEPKQKLYPLAIGADAAKNAASKESAG